MNVRMRRIRSLDVPVIDVCIDRKEKTGTKGMGRAHQIELPITAAVCQILFEKLAPREAVHALLTREAKQEGH